MPVQGIDFQFKGYHITSDQSELQPEAVHHWLSTESYWAQNIPLQRVLSSIANSFCVGALQTGRQIGFARFITDYTTFGYLADVYVEGPHQKKGLARAMCGAIIGLPWAKDLRRVMLATRDAHAIYAGLGFTAIQSPDRLMEIVRPNIYQPDL